jgi:hypothetical protein
MRFSAPDWSKPVTSELSADRILNPFDALLPVGPFLFLWRYSGYGDTGTGQLIDPQTLEVVAEEQEMFSQCRLALQGDAVLGFRANEVLEGRLVSKAPPERSLCYLPVRGTDKFFSVVIRETSWDPRCSKSGDASEDARGNILFLNPCREDDNFYTQVMTWRAGGGWSHLAASGVVPIRLSLPLRPAGPAWLCSVLSNTATVAFLRPQMAYWAAVQFPQQLLTGGAPIMLRDAPGVLAWEQLVLLMGDAAPPSFLQNVPAADARVLVGRPVPLPPHLPRPRLLRESE